MNKTMLPKAEFVRFYRNEGRYNLLNPSEVSAQYVFIFPHLTREQIAEKGLKLSYLVDIDSDYEYDPKDTTALDLAYELKKYFNTFLYHGSLTEIEKLCSYLDEIEENQEKLRAKHNYEYALAKIDYWRNKAEQAKVEMEELN